MKDDNKILGDINPEQKDSDIESLERPAPGVDDDTLDDDLELDRPASEASRQDRTQHAGSRDVTEGTTGGTGTETGGTRNFRTGTGATGGDIGNRPE